MKISVLIPTYNSSRFIRQTLDSVLAQTLAPFEILVMDDGSTDNTVEIIRQYFPQIVLLEQPNSGTATARNNLCTRAKGDLLAFLDHDDLWHPEYLAHHHEQFRQFPQAVASFLGHETFPGWDTFTWPDITPVSVQEEVSLIRPSHFIYRYHSGIGDFMSMSFCCIPKRALEQLGPKPFRADVSGVDDFFLFNQLPLYGPIAFSAKRLCAYRITSQAQSVNRLKASALAIQSLIQLRPLFPIYPKWSLHRAFAWAFAVQRREFGRILMGDGQIFQARKAFLKASVDDLHPISIMKSLRLLVFTYLPRRVQPRWLPPLQTSQ